MTLTPGNTPPPAPRKPISTPPPPPRKPRRGVRKRRRPPREPRAPACVVCNKKRPLRHSGLCWSLECALQAADDSADTNPRRIRRDRDPDPADKHPRPPCVPPRRHAEPLCDPPPNFVRELPRLQMQLRGCGDAEERIDRRSSDEEIQKQEKDVHRADPSLNQETGQRSSENSHASHESDRNDNEPVGT